MSHHSHPTRPTHSVFFLTGGQKPSAPFVNIIHQAQIIPQWQTKVAHNSDKEVIHVYNSTSALTYCTSG
jgi:hypothetical protein